MISELKDRGCIHDLTHEDKLSELLKNDSLSFYCGFDPTADSLHVGSMLPLLIMRKLQKAGHKPILLLGTGTGMIGDPSGKSEERVLLDEEQIKHNAAGIEKQVEKFLDSSGKNAFKLVRNDTWLRELDLITFLRDVGKHFSVNSMMAKDSVKTRLSEREQGISYTEFTYMLLQAYDYYHLNKEHGCRLQIGGSDQWGNITAGLELIKRKNQEDTDSSFGLTFPLITNASGTKFGKTEKGVIWLDAERTSPYHFYQYWMNSSDEDILKYIDLFSEEDTAKRDIIKKEHLEEPHKRLAQTFLAEELTKLLHGEDELTKAQKATQVLFGGSLEGMESSILESIFEDVPSFEISRNEISGEIPLIDLLVKSSACKSKSDARRRIEGGGVYVNNQKIEEASVNISNSSLIDEKLIVLRIGKKNYHIVKAV